MWFMCSSLKFFWTVSNLGSINQNDLNWFAFLNDVESIEKFLQKHSNDREKLLKEFGKGGLGMNLNPFQISAHFECYEALLMLLQSLEDLSEDDWTFSSGIGK